jgi:CRISPR/Cas system-associated exonuclease Cas4 (RecB family)
MSVLGDPEVDFTRSDWITLFNEVTDWYLPRMDDQGNALKPMDVEKLRTPTVDAVCEGIERVLKERSIRKSYPDRKRRTRVIKDDSVARHVRQAIEEDNTTFKTWDGQIVDRQKTVGASEVFSCIRRIAYDKQGYARDPGYKDGKGYMVRGNVFEAWFMIALLSRLPPEWTLMYTGEDQRTYRWKELSATPDGLVVLPDGTSFLIEVKSHDPRANVSQPKPNHIAQVKQQLALVRKETNYEPTHAIIVYINCSDLSLTEHRINYDRNFQAIARKRAQEAMQTQTLTDLTPEGSFADECRYCPWAVQCGQSELAAVPGKANGKTQVDPMTEATLAVLLAQRDQAVARGKSSNEEKVGLDTKIKKVLRDNNISKLGLADWAINYSTVSGRKALDIKAVEEAGFDLNPFYRQGRDSVRLSIVKRHQ